MAKNESTAVNELISLVSTQTPRKPDADEDLMFQDPSKRKSEPPPAPPIRAKPVSVPRMTQTVPPMRGAGEVEPLPPGRGASGTQKVAAVGPQVRVSTAPPSRQTTIPPLSTMKSSIGMNPKFDLSATSSVGHNLPASSIGITVPPPPPAASTERPAKPALPPPARTSAPPAVMPVAAPYQAPLAPSDMTRDQPWFEDSAPSESVTGQVPNHEETWVGTVGVKKPMTTVDWLKKLAPAMVGMVVLGAFVGGFIAFGGGHKHDAQPTTVAAAEPAPSAPAAAAAAEPKTDEPAPAVAVPAPEAVAAAVPAPEAVAAAEPPKTETPAPAVAAPAVAETAKPAVAETAKPAVAETAAPAVAETAKPAVAETAVAKPVEPPPSVTEPVKPEPTTPPNLAVAAAVPAPALAPTKGRPVFVDIRIDSKPEGATVMIVDRGKTNFLGTTPIATSVDPSRQYDLVFTYKDRPTRLEHLDPRTQSKLMIAIDRRGAKPEVAKAAPAVAPVVVEKKKSRPAPAPAAAPKIEKVAAVEAAPVAETVKSAGEGTLMISTKPPCEIVVDGTPTGLTTPQRALKLTAGKHSITLINSAESIKKTVSISITPDQSTKVIQDLMKK